MDLGRGSSGARFKGKLGVAVRKAFKELLVDEGRDRDAFIAALPEPVRPLLEARYVATNWYPLDEADHLMSASALELGVDEFELSRRIGGDVAYESAGRIGWTILSLFASPHRVARHLQTMWNQIYDSGEIECDYDAAAGTLVVERSDWHGHAPHTCMTLLGSLERLGQNMRGYRLVEARRVCCVSEEDAETCRFEFQFEEE